MLVVQEALREYSVALGLPPEAVPPEDRRWHAAFAPTPPPAPPRTAGRPAELSDWWTGRVDVLTGTTGAGVDDPAQTSADLLHRCTLRALDGDRPRLRGELAGAGPAVGLGLAAVAPPLLRFLAAELVAHPPRLEDLAAVRRAALPTVPSLLPNMPTPVAEELLARVCHAQQQRTGGAPQHPVDSAVAGAVLVAALLRATGRSADDLGSVTEQLRRTTEAERVRSGLRHAEGAEPRRAPAVEALLGKASGPVPAGRRSAATRADGTSEAPGPAPAEGGASRPAPVRGRHG